MLLVSSASTGLWALDPTNGRLIWRIPIPEGGITAPVPVAGALMVGTTRYGLFLISPINGRVIDGFDLGSGFAQTPAAYGTRAFVLSNAGTLLGLQIEAPIVRGHAAN
jgi:outer membrane protein assembly factor BamB